jgi:Arc/MetJ-type ribon-helix-helix transcriptional regulator
MTKTQTITYWNIPVPVALNEALEQAILLGNYRTKAEYVRNAVRRMLETQGLNKKLHQQTKVE